MYKIKLDGKILYYPGDREAAVINPELDLQTGYAGELTLKVPALNPLYNDIHNRKSMISVYRDKTEIFYGEVRTREKDRFKINRLKQPERCRSWQIRFCRSRNGTTCRPGKC